MRERERKSFMRERERQKKFEEEFLKKSSQLKRHTFRRKKHSYSLILPQKKEI